MVNPEIKERILGDLERLEPGQQQRAAELVHGLLTPLPKGASVDDLIDLAGTLDDESARQMTEAIEESCERVDLDGGGKYLLDTSVAIQILTAASTSRRAAGAAWRSFSACRSSASSCSEPRSRPEANRASVERLIERCPVIPQASPRPASMQRSRLNSGASAARSRKTISGSPRWRGSTV